MGFDEGDSQHGIYSRTELNFLGFSDRRARRVSLGSCECVQRLKMNGMGGAQPQRLKGQVTCVAGCAIHVQ